MKDFLPAHLVSAVYDVLPETARVRRPTLHGALHLTGRDLLQQSHDMSHDKVTINCITIHTHSNTHISVFKQLSTHTQHVYQNM